MNRQIFALLIPLLLWGGASNLLAQGTAFNYQGQLNVGGVPANGSYDLRFAVFDAVTNGAQISVWLTNDAVVVSNGLFTTTLGYGPGIFSGTNYWLDIAVRPAGGSSFTSLVPRQPILPVPYAIFANTASNVLGSVSAGQLTGTLPASQIAGTSASQVSFINSANTFYGTFNGNGASLTNLNGSQITSGTVADARLSANVALLDNNQTFTGNNQFNGQNNFTNWANNFTGNFFGNGLIGWITTNGTVVQAVRDHGYMMTSSGMATVKLPPNSGLTNGDIVRISGAGGGWLVAENSGQSIIGNMTSYRNCVLRTLFTGDYHGVAASADGTFIYGVGNALQGVYVSSNPTRLDWGPAGGLTGYYYSIACSANGAVVYAEPTSGAVRTSSNYGATWTSTTTSYNGTFLGCTADGSKFFASNYACSGNGTYLAKLSGGAVSISTNGGSSWSSSLSAPASFNCLAASSDCTKLVAGASSGLLYATSNQGATWTALTSTNQYWTGAWMSPDGSQFAASAGASGSYTGGIYYGSVSPFPNTVSTNSSIGGGQGTAVELQYIGNGQFMPISSSGTIWAN